MLPYKTENSTLQHTHPLGRIWISMLGRCYYECNPSYPHYGGRGIRVHRRWFDLLEFSAYIDKELGPRPSGCSIDRLNNDRGYVPGNIRWASSKQQARNRRSK